MQSCMSQMHTALHLKSKYVNDEIIYVDFAPNVNDECSKSADKKLNRIGTISHEATHVALDIYDYIEQNICNCSPEPFCYLQEWAFECIYKTLSKK